MAGSETNKRLSFWPKLLLWGAVLLVGSLYIGSIHDRRDSKDPVRQPTAPTAGSALDIAPAGARVEAQIEPAPTDQVAARVESVASERLSPQTPRQATIPSATPAAAPVVAATAELAEPAGEARAPDLAAKPSPEVKPEPQSPTDETDGESVPDVTPAEAEAFARAVMSEPQAEELGSESPGPGSSSVAETLEERRARIIAEYESMRRRAQEEMRRRWESGGMHSPPYIPRPSYPVYSPRYHPPARYRVAPQMPWVRDYR
jgi:hypothetical protein